MKHTNLLLAGSQGWWCRIWGVDGLRLGMQWGCNLKQNCCERELSQRSGRRRCQGGWHKGCPQGTAAPLPGTPDAEILQLSQTRIKSIRLSTVTRTCTRGKYQHTSSPHAGVGAVTRLAEASGFRNRRGAWLLRGRSCWNTPWNGGMCILCH